MCDFDVCHVVSFIFCWGWGIVQVICVFWVCVFRVFYSVFFRSACCCVWFLCSLCFVSGVSCFVSVFLFFRWCFCLCSFSVQLSFIFSQLASVVFLDVPVAFVVCSCCFSIVSVCYCCVSVSSQCISVFSVFVFSFFHFLCSAAAVFIYSVVFYVVVLCFCFFMFFG